MEQFKSIFKQKELDLIEKVLKTNRLDSTGKTISWYNLAKEFNIRPEGNKIQRGKSANDIWRRFIRNLKRNNVGLEVVKQTLNGNGDVLFETRKKPIQTNKYSKKGLEIKSITTNPYGGEWITYHKETNSESIIIPAIEKLINKYLTSQPSQIKKQQVDISQSNITTDALAVVNLYDAHLDKIPIKSTCGVESTLEKNIDIFKLTVLKIKAFLQSTATNPYIIETILLPLGNDLFHTNGFNSQTKKGTQIEYLCSPEEAYYKICDVVTWTIKILSEVCKVEVLMIKGNHDEDKIAALGYWLDRYFYDDKRVQVDYTRRQRKYYKYGKNLLGFAHGDKEKFKISQLPLLMAQESGEYWGHTKYRKFYLGDLHHGFEYQFLKAKDMPGVEIEYLRSVGTTDTWHEDFGYIGIPKTAYVQIFDKQNGEIIRRKFPVN